MKPLKPVHLATMAALLSVTANCYASGASTGMPWEGPLETVLESITGPVAKVIGVLAIVVVGLTMAFSEGGGVMKKVLNVVMGLTICFSASTFFLSFFGYGSGLGF